MNPNRDVDKKQMTLSIEKGYDDKLNVTKN